MNTILTFFVISTLLLSGCNLFESSKHSPAGTSPIDDADVSNGNIDAKTQKKDMTTGFPKTCSDGLKNGMESDFDCGGICRPCADGRACLDIQDCASNFCEDNVCAPGPAQKTCENGVLDPDETEIDCGGNCVPCTLEGEPWWQPQWNKRQKITFQVEQDSVDIRLFIRLEESNSLSASHVRFVLNGTLLASEIDEVGSKSFWVLFPSLSSGKHELLIYSECSDPTLLSPKNPWDDSIAIYHIPDEVDAQQNLGVPVSTAQPELGLLNSATRFDGTTHVSISDLEQKLDTLFPTFSISAWIKPTAATGVYNMVASRQFSTNSNDDFAFGFGNGKLTGCTNMLCTTGDTVPLNVWSHIAFVYDGQIGYLYMNGVLAASRPLPRIAASISNDLIIGGNRNTSGSGVQEFFYGVIDELRISDKVLTPNTILTQFEAHTPGFFIYSAVQTKPN